MFGHIYEGRRVFVTGHTGFKGSWLTAWLLQMGAEVAGFSDAVPTGPSHFDVIGLGGRIRDCRGDVRDRKALVEIWDAACAALPHKLGGRELTVQDIIPKAAAVDGKPTDIMPAKPVRKRTENNK